VFRAVVKSQLELLVLMALKLLVLMRLAKKLMAL